MKTVLLFIHQSNVNIFLLVQMVKNAFIYIQILNVNLDQAVLDKIVPTSIKMERLKRLLVKAKITWDHYK